MNKMKDVRESIHAFLQDDTKKKVVINVPEGFRLWKTVNPLKLIYRKAILFIQQWIVPSRFKNGLLRSAGLTIGRDVCIPHYIHFDPYFPELITVDPGSLIGALSSLKSHTLEKDKLTLGRVHVKEKVLLAGMSTIEPGVTVNSYSITGIHSHITKDVPERSFVAGKDKRIKEWSDEEVDRHFGDSKNDPSYYKELKRKAREFRKDPEMMRVAIRNNGKRLNPGNEWYLARPWIRIYYNALFVELARIVPGNWLRKLLLRIMGATIGKNVYIGKNVVFDHIYGDMVTIEDNAYIGDGSYLDGHSYTIGESVFGRVLICENARLDGDIEIMCGVKVGKNARIKKHSSVLKDVPDGETWSGIPAKPEA